MIATSSKKASIFYAANPRKTKDCEGNMAPNDGHDQRQKKPTPSYTHRYKRSKDISTIHIQVTRLC